MGILIKKMRPITYPPAVRVFLKAVPAHVIFLYLTVPHPLMLYWHQNHAHERIDTLFYRTGTFQKYARRRDEITRNYDKEQCNMQPTDLHNGRRQCHKAS